MKQNESVPIWQLGIEQIEGKSLDRKGRETVNEMLSNGWVLLNVYTLKYKDDTGEWIERPMGVLGWPKNKSEVKKRKRFPPSVVH